MRQNDITNLPKLPSETFENIFDVYQEESGMYYYNLLQTLVFPKNLPPGAFVGYNVVPGDSWPFISYKNYNTTKLWWLVLLANEIDNPTVFPKPGTVLLIPNETVTKTVLAQIKRRS